VGDDGLEPPTLSV